MKFLFQEEVLLTKTHKIMFNEFMFNEAPPNESKNLTLIKDLRFTITSFLFAAILERELKITATLTAITNRLKPRTKGIKGVYKENIAGMVKTIKKTI